MPDGYWTTESLKVIGRVKAENPGATPEDLRKLVSKAYPFGERKHYPYRAWQAAVLKELGPSERKIEAQARLLAELKARIGQGEL